jgi:hypothetical protein
VGDAVSKRYRKQGLTSELTAAQRKDYQKLMKTGGDGSEGTDSDGQDASPIPRSFLSYPTPNPVVRYEEGDDGLVTLIYKKNFGRFEKWLHSKIGGPEDLRRPLDEQGSKMWKLMDGEHTILDICVIMDKEYKEEMAPVLKKVRLFLERLLILNLIILKLPEEDGEDEEDDDAEEGEKEGEDGGTEDQVNEVAEVQEHRDVGAEGESSEETEEALEGTQEEHDANAVPDKQ